MFARCSINAGGGFSHDIWQVGLCGGIFERTERTVPVTIIWDDEFFLIGWLFDI